MNREPSGAVRLRWDSRGAPAAEVYAQALATLRAGRDFAAVACGVSDEATLYPPPAGVAWLVAARCGDERSALGHGSRGAPILAGAAACP